MITDPTLEAYAVAMQTLSAANDALKRENELLRAKERTIAEMDDAINELGAENEVLKRECARYSELIKQSKDRELKAMRDLQEAREQVLRLDGLIEKQIEELVAARAKLEECERDAKRYRWLRDKCDTTTGFLLCQRREAHEWDAEIDATIESFTAIDALAQDSP